MITIKTPEEIILLREGGKRLASVLRRVVERVRPGVSTCELDAFAQELILHCGGVPSFKGYRLPDVQTAFPATICASVNDEVVHSIPREDRILQMGDIIGIDIGMWYPADATIRFPASNSNKKRVRGSVKRAGLATDMAVTVPVGEISEEAAMLLSVTKEALNIGINAVVPGKRVGDISYAIQTYLDKHGLGIVRGLAGHGVGYEVHEEPMIPNYGQANTGPDLKEGMVIAIEPMATLGGDEIKLDNDQWTFRTADGSLAAHFEHSVAVTKDGAEVLTLL